MENVWRFFDGKYCIGGIVFARSEEEAIYNTKCYLVRHFTDITNEDSLDVCVWKIENDDEYNRNFPYAVATNY